MRTEPPTASPAAALDDNLFERFADETTQILPVEPVGEALDADDELAPPTAERSARRRRVLRCRPAAIAAALVGAGALAYAALSAGAPSAPDTALQLVEEPPPPPMRPSERPRQHQRDQRPRNERHRATRASATPEPSRSRRARPSAPPVAAAPSTPAPPPPSAPVTTTSPEPEPRAPVPAAPESEFGP